MVKKALNIDEIDRRILARLQENARVSLAEVARSINMAPSAVHERLRKLEAAGVVQGYELRLDPKALGLGLTCFISVRTEETVGSTETGSFLAQLPQVQEVHFTAGYDCYLLKVRVEDTEALGQLLRTIGLNKSVRDTRTTIVLTTVKETAGLPVATSEEEQGVASK